MAVEPIWNGLAGTAPLCVTLLTMEWMIAPPDFVDEGEVLAVVVPLVSVVAADPLVAAGPLVASAPVPLTEYVAVAEAPPVGTGAPSWKHVSPYTTTEELSDGHTF